MPIGDGRVPLPPHAGEIIRLEYNSDWDGTCDCDVDQLVGSHGRSMSLKVVQLGLGGRQTVVCNIH